MYAKSTMINALANVFISILFYSILFFYMPFRIKVMFRLQKYLIPLESQIPDSKFYATAYLKLNLADTDKLKEISETVTRTNQILDKNIKKLRTGYYDSKNLPFKLDPCTSLQLDLPYDIINNPELEIVGNNDISSLIHDKYFKNQMITPNILNCSGFWPKRFRYIGSKVRTSEFHVSLLPLIRFENFEKSIEFFKLFENFIDNRGRMKNMPIKFSSLVKILPKYDYSKFFLGKLIDRNDSFNTELSKLQIELSNLRLKGKNNMKHGHVTGELDNYSVVDWSLSCLHMTVGVCNKENSLLDFGQNELAYLNEILLDDVGFVKNETVLDGELIFVLNGEKILY